jgi:hypothetical protein
MMIKKLNIVSTACPSFFTFHNGVNDAECQYPWIKGRKPD